MDLIIVKG